METLPQFTDIISAHHRIKIHIHNTPVLQSRLINQICGCSVFFKCENFQKAGAFKYRGATNAILQLSENQAKNGVATHSSGNHAGALALAASLQGIKAHIVMPQNAPEIKKQAVLAYGAEITFCEPTLEAREKTLELVVDKTGATEIHPYNNFNVICGQGTATLELLDKYPDLDFIIAPVGGGGLLSGTALAASGISKNITVIGAEPEGANDALKSFRSGQIYPSVNPNTICDGLLTALGTMTFSIIQKKVNDILTVNDTQITLAMQLIFERLKIVIEPSSAITLAVVLANKNVFKNKNIGIILSGGNVDLRNLPFH